MLELQFCRFGSHAGFFTLFFLPAWDDLMRTCVAYRFIQLLVVCVFIRAAPPRPPDLMSVSILLLAPAHRCLDPARISRNHTLVRCLAALARRVQKIGCKPQIINEYEQGKGIPDPAILSKISRVIKIKLTGKNVGELLNK